MNNKKETEINERKIALSLMNKKMEAKKVKELAQSIDDLTFFLSRKITKAEVEK